MQATDSLSPMAETNNGEEPSPSDHSQPTLSETGSGTQVPPASDDIGSSLDDVDEVADEPPPGASLTRNISVLFGSQMVTWSIALVTIAVIPRALGPAAIGQFTVVGAVWLIVSMVATAGTSTVVTLEVAKNRQTGGAVMGPVILARTCVFVLAAAAVAVYVALSDAEPVIVFMYVVIGIGTYIGTIGGVARDALQGYESFGGVARSEIITRLLGVVAILVLLVGFGQGLRAVAVVTAATAVLQAILLLRSLRPYHRIHLSLEFGAARKVLKQALPFFAGGVLVTVYHQIDVVIMSALVDEDRVGWYAAADRLFGTALFIPTIVMSAVFPVLARLHTSDADSAKELVSRAFRTLIVVGLPIGVGTMVLARPIAELLFGNDFSEAGPVLGVIGIVLMLTFQTVLFGNYAVATGRQRYIVVVMAIAIAMTVPLDLVLVPWTESVYGNGAIGGALSYVVTELFILIVVGVGLTPEVFSKATLVRLLRCGVAAGLMVAAVWPLRNVFPLVGILVGAVVYVVALLVQRPFEPEESAALGRLWRKVGAKLPLPKRFVDADQ
jgi:O-antigen/teichoic acid export membrane protein